MILAELMQINEAKVSAKAAKTLTLLAQDKTVDMDDFKHEFSMTHNSAIEVWMEDADLNKLRKLVAEGRQVLSLSLDTESKTFAASIVKAAKAGWQLLAEERNYESYEAIFYK